MKMKRVIILAGIITCIAFFAACKKESSDNYTLTTYTQTDSGSVYLFVNEQSKGQLPYIADGANDCNDNRALTFTLDPGTYNISVKDDQNLVKNALIVNVSEDGDVTTGTNYTYIQIDRCITLGVDY